MNIAVIAAGGRSGQAFVEAALAAGHSVRAGTLHTHRLAPHPKLTIITCDAMLEADLENLFQGQDAVASFIGHVKGSAENVQTVAIENTATAMQRLGLKRLVSLTGTGVRLAEDNVPVIDRILNLALLLVNPTRIWDGRHHVDALRKTKLDWTVIRVLRLHNSRPGAFELRANGPTKWFTSRKEVAQAALQVLEQRSFVRELPIICKPSK